MAARCDAVSAAPSHSRCRLQARIGPFLVLGSRLLRLRFVSSAMAASALLAGAHAAHFALCEAPDRTIASFRSLRSPRHHHGQPSLIARRALRQSRARWAPLCQAAGFSQAGGDKNDSSKLPQSREDAVQQAATAIAAQLGGTGSSKGKKGFASGTSCRKLTVDVPIVESGAAAMLQLAQDILAALPKQLRQQFTIVACNEAAASAHGGGVPVVSLQQCLADGRDLEGCLLIAGPTGSQLDATMRLLAYWRGPAAVALNADWSAEQAPVEQASSAALTVCLHEGDRGREGRAVLLSRACR